MDARRQHSRNWKGISASAGGFVKCIAQVGGACAGYPLGLVQTRYGWDGVFSALAAFASLAGLAALPLWWATAQNRIAGRSGTVADFKSMESSSNLAGLAAKQAARTNLGMGGGKSKYE